MNDDRELERLQAALPRSIQPVRDLWPGIAARIRSGQVVDGGFAARPAWRRPTLLAAAAAGLIVATAAVTAVLLREPPASVAAGPGQVVQNFASVESEFAGAADDLLHAVRAGRAKLSPATVAVLERNLRIIDDAIRESREALARDPANTTLRDMVLGGYRHKLDLLRRAAAAAEL